MPLFIGDIGSGMFGLGFGSGDTSKGAPFYDASAKLCVAKL